MKNKSVIEEAEDIQRAAEMVRLGARMQMLESETKLSRERLLKIYKEVRGVSPPKGMLPFSTDWFMTWQPNVHASVFMAFFRFFELRTGLAGINALRTPHPMLEGTRIRALTQVIATQPLNDTLGAVRLRLYLFGDHLPDPNAPKVNDGTRYYNHIGMDMDYWELIPTIKGARGVVRGR